MGGELPLAMRFAGITPDAGISVNAGASQRRSRRAARAEAERGEHSIFSGAAISAAIRPSRARTAFSGAIDGKEGMRATRVKGKHYY